MAKEKNSSGESAPTTSVKSKQSTSRKTASPSRLKVVASSSPAKTASSGPSPAELDQEIRLRAYEFFCERGGQHGAHEDDWLRAEQEVCAKYHVKYIYGT